MLRTTRSMLLKPSVWWPLRREGEEGFKSSKVPRKEQYARETKTFGFNKQVLRIPCLLVSLILQGF